MEIARSLRSGIFVVIVRVAIVVAAVIVCLVVGAFSLNAHNDWLLILAALSALAAFCISVLGAVWIFRSIRALVRSMEK